MGLENLIAAVDKVRYPDVLLLIAGVLVSTLQVQIVLGWSVLGFVSDQQLGLAYRAADFPWYPQ